MMNASKAYEALRIAQIAAARGALSMQSSADLAANDAEACYNRGDFESCMRRSLHSLAYSVGIFGAEHAKVKRMCEIEGVRAL